MDSSNSNQEETNSDFNDKVLVKPYSSSRPSSEERDVQPGRRRACKCQTNVVCLGCGPHVFVFVLKRRVFSLTFRPHISSENGHWKRIFSERSPECSLRYRRNWTLVKSVCETAPKFLFWARTCVPGFEYEPLLTPLKKPMSIRQSGWEDIRNVLPVIRWVRWGPRKKCGRCSVDVTNRGKMTSAIQAI